MLYIIPNSHYISCYTFVSTSMVDLSTAMFNSQRVFCPGSIPDGLRTGRSPFESGAQQSLVFGAGGKPIN